MTSGEPVKEETSAVAPDAERKSSGLELVTANDFEAVGCDAPIASSRKVYCPSLSALYRKAADDAEQQGNEQARRVYRLLADLTHMHFKPDDKAEPYGPLLVMDGKRSIVPDDIRGEQSTILASIAPKVKNPGVRALFADIAWLNDRKQAASAQLAVMSFCAAVQSVADGEAELFFDDAKATSHNGAELLRRACQVANMTRWKEPSTSTLKALIASLTQRAFEERDARGYLNLSELDADYHITVPATVAAQAEILAITEGLDPHASHDLWELAARAHRQSGSEDESNRCLISAAECYVNMASAAGFAGMTASSWLMDAIKALRNLPGTKVRRQELETKLREAQASISDEMGLVSTEIDLTDLVDQTHKTIGGLTLAQALFEFARLEQSPPPEKLREAAMANANENPLSSIIPMSIHDDDGKVVAKSPGLAGRDEEHDTAIRHLIARHEGFRRHIAVSGMIDPGRRMIMAEHPLHTRHFLPLAESSPFVPAGHEDIYALGFARFFAGDYISALHILVPQLENSLRYVLKQVAVDPSSIQSDMTQENRTVSVMLDKDRSTLEKIFGPAIIFEIENLFDFRGGPTIRHQLAHGLVSSGSCYGFDAKYACWFMFRLCCLPLFRHWQKIADRYANLS